MNKILALTIFRAAQFDFKKRIAVILQGSNLREFEARLKQFLSGYGVSTSNIIVFDASDLSCNDKLRGYRVVEVLIEGDSIKDSLLNEHIMPMICSISDISLRRNIIDSFQTPISLKWENQKIFFSE